MAWAHVQGPKFSGNLASATSIAATGSVVGSGNLVVGCVTWDSGAGTVINSVTDDKGNAYTVSENVNDAGNGQCFASFVLGNITNGPKTVTVNFGASHAYRTIIWDEYSGGAALADPRDGHAGQVQTAPGTGTDGITSGSITTTVNGDLIWCATCNTSNSTLPSAGTGFTAEENDVTVVPCATEDKTQSTAGAVSGTFTTTSNVHFVTLAIALKAAGGGSTAALLAASRMAFAAKGAIAGVARVMALSRVAVSAKGAASYKAQLAATTVAQVKAAVTSAGKTALTATSAMQVKAGLTSAGRTALAARSAIATTAKAGISAGVNLIAVAGATKIVVTAKAGMTAAVNLAGRTMIAATARMLQPGAIALMASAFVKFTGKAVPRGAAALAARTLIKVTARALLLVFAPSTRVAKTVFKSRSAAAPFRDRTAVAPERDRSSDTLPNT